MYSYGNGTMSGWGWALTTIGMILFWGVLIAAGIALYRHFSRSAQPQTPQQILAERYARGEIDEDEYTSRLSILRNHDRQAMRS
jgi:putative membrane protein